MAAALMLPRLTELNPARCWRTAMSPEVNLAAKLAWLLLLCSGFLARAGHPGAALVPGLDRVVGAASWIVPALFLVAGAALLTNQAARTAAAVAGACVVLTTAASLATWRSHEWICGAVLLLASLQQPGERPWLLRAQATLCLAAIVFDPMRSIDWSTRASLEGWQVGGDSASLLQVLRSLLPVWGLQLLAGWVAPATALLLVAGLWVQRWRGRALWTACAWLVTGYALVGTDDAAWFTLATLVALLAFLDWPRESLAAHWPRACGWPMWLRIALDHYDFDHKTEWPFPQNPDADLDVWVDGRHLPCRDGLAALLLYFPLFHASVIAVAVALLLALPQPWALIGHVCLAGWLLVFFARPVFAPRLRAT